MINKKKTTEVDRIEEEMQLFNNAQIRENLKEMFKKLEMKFPRRVEKGYDNANI